ncbi:MAG: PTS transporter subunit EIIC [Clostridiales bacterium]|nr:PTS transporter subunit EIIC [Clostridiales bacterium]
MKLLAVTSCPTGIAHTYMAAEALQMAAKKVGVDIKIETYGSIGVENEITEEEIKKAHAVIIAADTKIDKSKFNGLPILEVGVQDAIRSPKELIEDAMKLEKTKKYVEKVEKENDTHKQSKKGPYQHLMTGVSYMLPFVVAGGILIALSFAFGIHAADNEGSLPWALSLIGGGSAFALMIPILSGFIAYSIADRPGLVPGMIGGMLSSQIGAGFLGGIIAGFLAGYTIVLLKKWIKLPKAMEGLMPVLVLPLLSSLIVGLLMIYVIGTPVATINEGLTNWLDNLQEGSAVVLGFVLGLMMAFDMGGPINKAAYTFGVGTIAAGQSSSVMAAVMAAGMTPPIGIGIATLLYKKKFTKEEKEAGKAGLVLGISFITEGAIPFAAADPIRVIPSLMAGSGVAGALTMLFKVRLAVPHGGIFVLPIPNAVEGVLLYSVAILIGSLITAIMVGQLKKPME